MFELSALLSQHDHLSYTFPRHFIEIPLQDWGIEGVD
jgi:hypothetical protein